MANLLKRGFLDTLSNIRDNLILALELSNYIKELLNNNLTV
jgi:hypothetical protein